MKSRGESHTNGPTHTHALCTRTPADGTILIHYSYFHLKEYCLSIVRIVMLCSVFVYEYRPKCAYTHTQHARTHTHTSKAKLKHIYLLYNSCIVCVRVFYSTNVLH